LYLTLFTNKFLSVSCFDGATQVDYGSIPEKISFYRALLHTYKTLASEQ